MGGENFGDVSEFLNELKSAREAMAANHAERIATVTELKSHIAKQDAAIDRLSARIGRPQSGGDLGEDDARAQAVSLLEMRHMIRTPKRENLGVPTYHPTEDEITEAKLAVSATKNLFRGTDAQLDYNEKKALSSFALGSNTFFTSSRQGCPNPVLPRRRTRHLSAR